MPYYVQHIHVHEVYMMNGVWSGPSWQQYRPRSKQCSEAHIYANTPRNKIINGR